MQKSREENVGQSVSPYEQRRRGCLTTTTKQTPLPCQSGHRQEGAVVEQCHDMTHGLMSRWGVGPEVESGFITALWTGRSALLPILGRTGITDNERDPPPPPPGSQQCGTAAVKSVKKNWNTKKKINK